MVQEILDFFLPSCTSAYTLPLVRRWSIRHVLPQLLTELFWSKLSKKSHHSLTLPLRWCILGFKPRTGNRFLYPSVIGLEGTSHVEWYSKTRTYHFMFYLLRNIPSSRMSTWRSCDLSRYNQRLPHLT
jgi:hypothetical protein